MTFLEGCGCSTPSSRRESLGTWFFWAHVDSSWCLEKSCLNIDFQILTWFWMLKVSRTSSREVKKWNSRQIVHRWKERWKESEKRKEEERRTEKRKKARREKLQVRKKVGKSQNAVFFYAFVAPEDRKVGSLKPGAEPSGRIKDQKVHTVVVTSWPEHFWKLAAVVRRTFRSQNVQNSAAPEHCTLHTLHSTLLTVHSTLHTLHFGR